MSENETMSKLNGNHLNCDKSKEFKQNLQTT
jgi:hypothetical protein